MIKQTIFILGNYRIGAADGLAEFNFQTVHLLKDEFDFQFIEFDNEKEKTFYKNKVVDCFQIHEFGRKNVAFYALPQAFS